MRLVTLILAVVILFAGERFLNAANQPQELPDFSSWTILFSRQQDFDKDGINDATVKCLNDTPDPKQASSALLLYSFRPIDPEKIDLAIWLKYTRTTESDKDTIITIHLLFFAREDDELVLIEERKAQRPRIVQSLIREPMFDILSPFGQRYVSKWRGIGTPPEVILERIPKWVWMPEEK